MLEALIAIDTDNRDGDKRQGDIIVVKPAGSSWCGEEQRTLQLVKFRDDALEAAVNASVGKVISYPYADHEAGEDGARIKRSTVRVNIDKYRNAAQIKDPRVKVQAIVAAEAEIITETPTGTGRKRVRSR
jgi:hypothetical protein